MRALFAQQAKACRQPVRLRLFNDGTSTAEILNRVAEAATAEYILFVGEGLPAADALACLARVAAPGTAALIYADGDELQGEGPSEVHAAPRLLPDFDHDLLVQNAYLGDLFAVRAGVFHASGGFRDLPDAVRDHDLWLRVTEHAAASEVVHVPVVLHRKYRRRPAPAGADARRFRISSRPSSASISRALVVPPRSAVTGICSANRSP